MAKQTLVDRIEDANLPAPKQDFALPSIFNVEEGGVDVKARATAPFVHLAQPKASDFWTKINMKYPGTQEGTAFLFDPSGDFEKLDPFKFSLVLAKQFFVHASASGDIISVSSKDLGKPYRERICTVLVCYTDKGLRPAVCEFRSTKCAAVHSMINRLKEAEDPSWANRSPAHALTMQLTKPFTRFYGVGKVSRRTSRGDNGGFNYALLTADTAPTTEVEWKMLADFMNDPVGLKLMETVGEAHDRAIREYLSKMPKT